LLSLARRQQTARGAERETLIVPKQREQNKRADDRPGD
jgi:hypothetical protein